MASSIPVQPGDVIQYSYLWCYEESQGHVDGRKDRPCTVMIIQADKNLVSVCPITHTPPEKGQGAQVPRQTCERLGLDDEKPCWIVTTEINQFIWPGPDIRKSPSRERTYGKLPKILFEKAKQQLLCNHSQGLGVVFRPED